MNEKYYRVLQLEEASKKVLDAVTKPRAPELEQLPDIQVLLQSKAKAQTLRNLGVS